MRNLSILFLLISLAAYLLAVLAKLGLLNPTATRPVSLVAFAGLNALMAAVLGILSMGNGKSK